MIELFENEIKVSQGYNVGSHTGNSRYAYDNCGRDTGISVHLYASTRLRVAHVDYKGGNGIYLHTLDKIQTNDINKYYGYLTIIIYHDNVVGHKVGSIINVGDIFYSEGTKGYATGNHIHLQVAKGHTTRYTCDILPHEVFYINPKKTKVYSLGSVPFTISETDPTNSNKTTVKHTYESTGRYWKESLYLNGTKKIKKVYYTGTANNKVTSVHLYESSGRYWRESIYYNGAKKTKKVYRTGTANNKVTSEHLYESTGRYWRESLYLDGAKKVKKVYRSGTANNRVTANHFYESSGRYWKKSLYYNTAGKVIREVIYAGTAANPIISDKRY